MLCFYATQHFELFKFHLFTLKISSELEISTLLSDDLLIQGTVYPILELSMLGVISVQIRLQQPDTTTTQLA
jgi:hypothetical protein